MHQARKTTMPRQSVSFTPPNDEWLNAMIESEEFNSKSEVINHSIRRERERLDKFNELKAAIDHGLASGISDKTVEDIRSDVIERLTKNGQLPPK